MEYWLLWTIVLAIGLVVGFILHAIMRFPQGVSMLATLAAGIIGAIIGAFIVPSYIVLGVTPAVTAQFVWAVLGAVVLSIASELLFAGTRRGHIIAG